MFGVKVYRLFFTAGVLFLTGFNVSVAQWGSPYSNAWIDNTNTKYVKMVISKRGIHKIPFSMLPVDFPKANPEKFQLFHRGEEISIISTDNQEITFYGVPNDGGSDSLFYRPMNSRLNPYSSIYSNQSSYFLTNSTTNGKRAAVISQEVSSSNNREPFHLQSDILANAQEYSHSTSIYIKPEFINSFYENGASRTGVRLAGDTLITFPYQLKNLIKDASHPVKIKLLIHGRSNNSRIVEIYIGKDKNALRKVKSVIVVDFIAQIAEFEIGNGDFNENGNLVLGVKSLNTQLEERFSIGFTSLTYPQEISMVGEVSKIFNLPSTDNSFSRMVVSELKTGAGIYDISNQNDPKIIKVASNDFLIPRIKGKSSSIFISEESLTVVKEDISSLKFQEINPTSFNYIIITNNLLFEEAQKYSTYRASAVGGTYKPLVIKITDIYDQFNYGEASPVAIRRFVDFMISDGNKDKYLFLFGKSITFVEKMLPELAEDVPSIGYPASDILLVEGLGGEKRDIPAIPVGRLSAVTVQHAQNYLQKVIEYEENISGEFEWKKKILHINGGKTTGEINTFKNSLSSLSPLVEEGSLGGEIKAFVKQSLIEVEPVNITPEVNQGVGMISYIGHGAQYVTDLDFGYISTVTKGYQNFGKYPLMYFNGCGVGNIFNARLNTNLNASDKIPLSLDWIVSEKKGAIAVIANSFESYLTPTVRYLNSLYTELFGDVSAEKLSIGQIQKKAVTSILSVSTDYMEIANVHQSLLQGDPALHLIRVDKADYSLDPEQSLIMYSESDIKNISASSTLKIAVIIANKGKFKKDEVLTVELKYFLRYGSSKVVTKIIPAMTLKDTIVVSIPNSDIGIERIEVLLDPNKIIPELDKSNNYSEMMVDWDLAKNQFVYQGGQVPDIVSPVLDVKFNGSELKNNEILEPNPTITFTLSDDRFVLLDSNSVDIYLKSCGDGTCDFKRLVYNGNIQIDTSSTYHSLKLTYFSSFSDGSYELLVRSKDKAGNSSPQPYLINFQISESTSESSMVVVSPNPSSSYVRFDIEMKLAKSLTPFELWIYDARGVLLETKRAIIDSSIPSEFYWFPKISGLYLYKIRLKRNESETEELSGKIMVTL